MITFQYVNDLAVFTANQNKKKGTHEFGSIAKRIMRNKKYRHIFFIEYNCVFGYPVLMD